METEQPEIKLVLLGDVSAAGGSLISYDAMLVPSSHFEVEKNNPEKLKLADTGTVKS